MGDGALGVLERAGEHGEFEVAVVLFGRGDGAVSELAGDEDQAVAGPQRARGGGVAQSVRWHGRQPRGARRVGLSRYRPWSTAYIPERLI